MKKSSGQVVLITLLVLTIATTVALSLISRTTTDTTITGQVEESTKAFSAAEAGIEEALKSGVGTAGALTLTGVTYKVNVAQIGGSAGLYEFPKKIPAGTTETVWLVPHNGDGTLDETSVFPPTTSTIGVCWSSEPVTPGLVITTLYKESSDGSYRILKAAYDANAGSRSSNFTSTYVPGGCGDGTTFYRENITFPTLGVGDILLMMRIRPVYNETKIVIDSGGIVLPQQGNKIESTGTTDTGTNRKILVFQQYRSAATVFDAALYSQQNLIK